VFAESKQVIEPNRVVIERREWERCGLSPIQRMKEKEGISTWELKGQTLMGKEKRWIRNDI
jgi:hypothetical protein